MRKNKDNILGGILLGLCLAIVVIAFICGGKEASGHYEPTDIMQPDGSYYIWVAD